MVFRVCKPLPRYPTCLRLVRILLVLCDVVVQGCMKEVVDCKWRQDWTDLARSFAFQYNPALQPRAIIVFGCISKMVSDSEVKQLLRILVKALESYTDLTLIEAIIMCLTRLQPLLRQVGSRPHHRFPFSSTITTTIDRPPPLPILKTVEHVFVCQGLGCST